MRLAEFAWDFSRSYIAKLGAPLTKRTARTGETEKPHPMGDREPVREGEPVAMSWSHTCVLRHIGPFSPANAAQLLTRVSERVRSGESIGSANVFQTQTLLVDYAPNWRWV